MRHFRKVTIKTNIRLLTFLFFSILLLSCGDKAITDASPADIPKYTVTFDSSGGSAVASQSVVSNKTATEPSAPTKTGYRLEGWYTNATFSGSKFDFSTAITADIALYAKWEIITYTVTFNSSGGSAVANQSVVSNETATEPSAPTKAGYGLVGWYTNATFSGSKFDFSTAITADITLYARWGVQPANRQELLDIINPAILANPTTNLNYIATSLITDMNSLFFRKSKFNGDISEWDTSSVTNMEAMFTIASAFNQNISNWNTSNVENMDLMFAYATNFNQNVINWNTSKVTDMEAMFAYASNFNQPIGGWNISKVENMAGMFSFAISFNQSIGGWNTSKVTDMGEMFRNATAFNYPIGTWNTSKVTDMSAMFAYASAFNQPVGGWNTSSVTNMRAMFGEASAFNQPIGGWDTTNVTDMSSMFRDARDFSQDLNSWVVSKVTSFEKMFEGSKLANNKPTWCDSPTPKRCD